jgi:hypothetical protein
MLNNNYDQSYKFSLTFLKLLIDDVMIPYTFMVIYLYSSDVNIDLNLKEYLHFIK